MYIMSPALIIILVVLICAISLIPMGYICSLIILSHQKPDSSGDNPKNYNLEYRSFNIEGSNNANLACWFVPAENSHAVLIVTHGIADSKNSIFPQLIPYVKAGFSLVVYDMRHHYESTGKYCTLGFWETKDLILVTKYVEKYLANNLPICYWGFSLGATVSILAAAKMENITAVVAQSPFVSLKSVVYYYSRKFYHFFPWPVIDIALIFFQKKTGAVFKEVDIKQYRKELHRKPVLLIGSERDSQVPLKWLKAIQYNLGPSAELLVGPYGHNDCIKNNSQRKDIEFAVKFLNTAIDKKIQMEAAVSES